MKDRRIARRYELSLPVIVHVSIDKETGSWTGRTRDISNHGIYFTIDTYLSAGTEMDLTVILPAEVTGGAEVFIRAPGKVIRVDERSGNGDQKVAMAAVFKRNEIVRTKVAIA